MIPPIKYLIPVCWVMWFRISAEFHDFLQWGETFSKLDNFSYFGFGKTLLPAFADGIISCLYCIGKYFSIKAWKDSLEETRPWLYNTEKKNTLTTF